jgi:hypothetical protein
VQAITLANRTDRSVRMIAPDYWVATRRFHICHGR